MPIEHICMMSNIARLSTPTRPRVSRRWMQGSHPPHRGAARPRLGPGAKLIRTVGSDVRPRLCQRDGEVSAPRPGMSVGVQGGHATRAPARPLPAAFPAKRVGERAALHDGSRDPVRDAPAVPTPPVGFSVPPPARHTPCPVSYTHLDVYKRQDQLRHAFSPNLISDTLRPASARLTL